MGKRKRRAEFNKTPPSDQVPYPAGRDSSLKETFSHLLGTSGLKPLSSIVDLVDNSVQVSTDHHSSVHRHLNFSRPTLSRQPRQYYGRKYSRRNPISHADASTSHGKDTPLHDEKLSFKITDSCDLDSGPHTDNGDGSICKPDRIRTSSLAKDAASSDAVRMVCGICQKQLRKKTFKIDDSVPSCGVSVIAVLVCGHVYHADCLEQRTCQEDQWDPPCPLCVGSP